MEGLTQKCAKCGKIKSEALFIGKRGKPVQKCQECQEKAATLKKSAMMKPVPEGKKICSNCAALRDLIAFKGQKGQECNHCQTCRESQARSDKAKKEKVRKQAIEGETKACSDCFKLLALVAFQGEHGQTYGLCGNCRARGAAKAKRQRESDPEKSRDTNRRSKQKMRDQSPLRVKRAQYHAGARIRGLEMGLNDEQMDALFQMSCEYCGESSSLNGIDRVDNSKGYVPENCVPCCSLCNHTKGKLDLNQFLTQSQSISFYQETGQTLGAWPFKGVSRVTTAQYRRNAAKNKRDFELTEEMFKSIISNACHYCGKKNDDSHQNGIDRKDNSIGYKPENCLACCWPCNVMKQETAYDEFINHCKKITAHSTKE